MPFGSLRHARSERSVPRARGRAALHSGAGGHPIFEPQATERLRRLSFLLDDAIPLPGGYRIGWDGIVGLVPGVGDFIGAALSTYIVVEAAKLGVAKSVLARMALNVLIETAVGAIPIAGDLFDMAFKANRRNVGLLERYLDSPSTTARRSGGVLLAVGGGALLAAGVVVLVLAAIVVASWRVLTG